MVPPHHEKRDYGWLLIVCAGLLPLLFGLICTVVEARHTVRQQQVNAAHILLTQAEKMSDSAWNMITSLRQYHYQSCSAIETQLQRAGTLNAYFRAIGKLEGDNVSCSSAYGLNPGTLAQMIRRPPPVTGKAWWSLSVAGTAGVPERPAMIFVRQLPDGTGFWAIIDGQYLIDFMQAIGESHGYQLAMRFDNGAPVAVGKKEEMPNPLFASLQYDTQSTRYPITLSVVAPSSEMSHAWRQSFFVFMPITAIFSILLMMLTANWLQRRLSWRDEIRRAIVARQFLVHYQPVYNNRSQRCDGVEALLRWRKPNDEWIRPDIFISAAETEGMIVPLTRHLLDLIAEDMQKWQVNPNFHLGINVAAEHLQHAEFVSDILAFAARVRIHQPLITLELTERSLIQDGVDVARKLSQLRAQGIKVAIDDFGTGHCSLTYLQNFPLDYLKIDRGFINAIEQLDGETPVLDAIINLSHKLALQVLGEGVETRMQLQYLKNRGVTFIQGYYYAYPMDNDALIAWLKVKGATPLDTSFATENQTRVSPEKSG
nr:EAL domain-containing protein [Pantoea sp.]